MAGTLKKVRLTVACGYGDVGFEFIPNGTTRDWLLARGWAVVLGPNGKVEEVKSNSGLKGAITRGIKGAAKRGADLLGQ